MSRDVAYRNGYLPLYAGAELVRRSGSLTQFPAENLIGTLPRPLGCDAYVNFTSHLVPDPSVPGVALTGVSRYGYQTSAIQADLHSDPSYCQFYADTLQEYSDVGGALPIVPEGTAVAPFVSNAGFFAKPVIPGGNGTGKMILTSLVNGVPTSHGYVTVNMVGGVQTLDTSTITTPLPATLSAGVCDIVTAQGDGFSTFSYLTMWTSEPVMGFTGGVAQPWVQCLNGGPCA